MKIDDEYLRENTDIIRKLRQIPALESFSEVDLKELLQLANLKEFAPGELILKEGSKDTWIFYLVSGKVRIVKGGRELVILKRIGDVFGEMGIVESTVRSASVYAIEKSVCLATDISLISSVPEENRSNFRYVIFRGFAEVLANRLRETTEELLNARAEIEKISLTRQLLQANVELREAREEIRRLKEAQHS